MLPVRALACQILAAEYYTKYIPSPLRRLMLRVGRHSESGIGSRIPPFPVFFLGFGRNREAGDLTGNPRLPGVLGGPEGGLSQ